MESQSVSNKMNGPAHDVVTIAADHFMTSDEDAMHTESTTVPRVDEIWAGEELLAQTRAGVEIWRRVVGSDGWYDVSNFGQVRTWRKRGSRLAERLPTPHLLTPNPVVKGYLAVTLTINGKPVCGLVNVLVCEAFIGPRPGTCREWHAAHYDGDKNHNGIDNIRWTTAKVNAADMARHGRKNACRKFQVIDGVKHYTCTVCKLWKPETDFKPLKRPGSKCGRVPACIPCGRERGNAYKRIERQRRI